MRPQDTAISLYHTTMIYNPVARGLRGRRRHRLERVQELLAGLGHQVSVVPTPGPGTAGAIARRSIEEGADLILVAGGDGTINEVLEGMAGSSVPLGILPAGTANVLATELGLPANLEGAAARLAEWVPRRIAIGRLDCEGRSRHFLLMAGIGFDAYIAYLVNPTLKARAGKIAYWIAGFSQAGRRLPEFELQLDDRTLRGSFVLVSRVRNYGGDFEIARNASLLDDQFEVVLFQGRNSVQYLKYLLGLVAGRLWAIKGVAFFRAQRVRLAGPPDQPVYIQVDGESAGRLPAAIEMAPDALTLLAPPSYGRR